MAYIQDTRNLLRILTQDDNASPKAAELQLVLEHPNASCKDVLMALLDVLLEQPTMIKDSRKFLKLAIGNIHKKCKTEAEETINEYVKSMFSPDSSFTVTSSALSFLLENCSFIRKLVSPYFDKIMKVASDGIQETRLYLNTDVNWVKIDDASCSHARLAVQVVQHLAEDVRGCIKNSDSDSHQRLFTMICNAVAIICSHEELGSSLQHLCAVFIGQVINIYPDDQEVSMMMYHICGQEQVASMPEKVACDGILSLKFDDKVNIGDLRYQICILKGLFSCVRPSPFIVEIGDCDNPTFLHHSLKLICASLQSLGEHKYHTFQVLKLWWVNVIQMMKSQQKDLIFKHFNEDGYFLKTNLRLLMNHWDDPISGVPALVLQIFTMLVKLHLVTKVTSSVDDVPAGDITEFLKTLFHNLTRLSPSVRGKYDFINVLISRVGTKFLLEEYPNFLDSLIPLLGINHLCPAVSKTYCAVVAETMRRSENSCKVALWKDKFVPGLLKVLFNANSVIRVNGLRQWLPVHLKQVPSAYQLLTSSIGGGGSFKVEDGLLAVIAVAKVARSENLIEVGNVDTEVLHNAFSDFNNDVRIEAFSLVCCHGRTSDLISERELELLKTYLPYNMNCDSPNVRQSIVFFMNNFLKRIRDSSAAYSRKQLKSKASPNCTSPTYEEICCAHIGFIVDLCLQSLHVSSSYQRKKTSLDLFSVLLGTFFSSDATKNISPKVQKIKETILCQDNATVFLGLFQDSVPEIRDLAFEILVKYFPLLDDKTWLETRKLATVLTRSLRARETESAAIIWEYIIIHNKVDSQNTSSSRNDGLLHQLSGINASMEEDLSMFITNTLVASQKSPVHGWMLALDRCLQKIRKSHRILASTAQNINRLLEILDSVEHNAQEVIKHTLTKIFGFGDASNQNEVTPAGDEKPASSADFSEITQRIERMILGDNKTVDVGNRNVLLTTDHEAILACCWLCLLRGSSLLSATALLKIELTTEDLQHESSLLRICQTFISILTGCRHRGAIDGCYENFLLTCKSLMSSKFSCYRAIPTGILKKNIDTLKNRGQSGSNVTRRSAGIPLVIEAVLVAEIGSGSSAIFSATMADIIDLAKQASTLTPIIGNDNYDFTQVHGLYILKHLFKNSYLGSSVLKYAESVFEIAYHCLSSPLWVVRNAATHLFGAVAGRMLGQKHMDGAHIDSLDNSVPCEEFFSHYPKLRKFVLEELSSIVADGRATAGKLPKSGLHPVLSVLSKLTHSGDSSAKGQEGLSNLIAQLLGSPVLQVRRLAAEALKGIMSEEAAVAKALTYLDKFPSETSSRCSVDPNLLHGHLLFVLLVATRNQSSINTCDFARLAVSKLLIRSWLWQMDKMPHPLVACTCMQILLALSEVSGVSLNPASMSAELSSIVKEQSVISSLMHQPGMSLHLRYMAKLVLDASEVEHSTSMFQTLLMSKVISVQSDAIEWATEALRGGKIPGKIHSIVYSFLISSNGRDSVHGNIMSNCMELLTMAASDNLTRNHEEVYQVTHNALTSELSPLSLRCSALKMLSSVGVNYLQADETTKISPDDNFAQEMISLWVCHIVSRTSCTEASEPLRMSASTSLKIAGSQITEFLVSHQAAEIKGKVSFSSMAGELICATISLLHDEQPDIRQHACVFISKLCAGTNQSQNANASVPHQYIATQRFLRYILQNCAENCDIMGTLFNHCFTNVKIKAKDQRSHELLFDKEPFNLYEEPVMIAKIYAVTFTAAIASSEIPSNLRQLLNENLCNCLKRIRDIVEKGVDHNYIAAMCALLGTELSLRLLQDSHFSSDKAELSSSLNLLLKACSCPTMLKLCGTLVQILNI